MRVLSEGGPRFAWQACSSGRMPAFQDVPHGGSAWQAWGNVAIPGIVLGGRRSVHFAERRTQGEADAAGVVHDCVCVGTQWEAAASSVSSL